MSPHRLTQGGQLDLKIFEILKNEELLEELIFQLYYV